jgi:polar amino acid transport system permease protein
MSPTLPRPSAIPARESRLLPVTNALNRLPYWLLAAIFLGVLFLGIMLTNADYRVILKAVSKGIYVTVYVTVIAYGLSLALGLVIGLMRVSGNRVAREVSTFYVEIIRGVPMLVILYYIAFVGAPVIISSINVLGNALLSTGLLTGLGYAMVSLSVRQVDFTARAITALTIGYSAFIAEIF